MTEEEVELRLNSIFKKYSNSENNEVKELVDRGWNYPKLDVGKKVLFVGINPSYTSEDKNKNISYRVKDAVKDYPKHYGKFNRLAKSVGLEESWTCIDLFYFRESNQKRIWELTKTKEGLEFICEQLQLTYEIMSYLKPQLIVVCNKQSQEFFGVIRKVIDKKEVGVWMGFEHSGYEGSEVKIVTDIKSNFLKTMDNLTLIGTPIIYSRSLLYMDKGHKEDLELSIKQAFQ